MKLIKPIWVSHEGFSIFSIDVHPDNSRFVTGGLGNNSSGRVVIWNLNAVLNHEDKSLEGFRLLCQLDHHIACVNCVRWSQSGKYLASGGDDKVIIIWILVSSNWSKDSSSSFSNIETWKVFKTLKYHDGDILDFNWSPGDNYLASASIDTKLVIWDAQNFPQVVKVINAHSSSVKGVTWDPVGKYLATQSDMCVKIWRVSDWSLEHTIDETFTDVGLGSKTVFLRLDWSPDGSYLISAHSLNSGGPTALIIERNGWRTGKDFVGHTKAIICVKWSHAVFSNDGKKSVALAVGSRDTSISVWSSVLRRPIVVIKDVFEQSVTDISWSQNSDILMACSCDGSVLLVTFNSKEIGNPLSSSELSTIHEKFYGKNRNDSESSIFQNIEIFVERQEKMKKVEVLKEQQNGNSSQDHFSTKTLEKKEESPKVNPIIAQHKVLPSTPKNLVENKKDDNNVSIQRQVESVTKDGKRRIVPTLLCDARNSISTTPFLSNSTTLISTSSTERVTLVNEAPSESVNNIKSAPPIVDDKNKNVNNIESSSSSECVIETNSLLQVPIPNTVQSTISSDLNKSPSNKINDTPIAQNKSENVTKNNNVKHSSESESDMDIEEIAVITHSRTKKSMIKKVTDIKERTKLTPAPSLDKKCSIKDKIEANKSKNGGIKGSEPLVPSETNFSPFSTPLNFNSSNNPEINYKFSQIQPKELTYEKKENERVIFRMSTSEPENRFLKCEHSDNSLDGLEWSVLLGESIVYITASSTRICVLSQSGTLYTFDLKGRFTTLPILSPHPPHQIYSNNNLLLLIDLMGFVTVIDFVLPKRIIRTETPIPIRMFCKSSNNTNLTIQSASMKQNGTPMILISDGKYLIYDIISNFWTVASNSNSFSNMLNSECCLGLIANPPLNSPFREDESLTKIKFKLVSAIHFSQASNVLKWIQSLANFYSAHGFKYNKEFKLLCQDLLGPTHSSSSKSSSWTPLIAGIEKRTILRSVLNNLIDVPRWHELYSEFNEQLKTVENHASMR